MKDVNQSLRRMGSRSIRGFSTRRIGLATIGIICLARLVSPALGDEVDDVRRRLTVAIDGTRVLMRNARESVHAKEVASQLFDDRKDLPARRFATRAEVARYAEERPWVQQYLLLLANESRSTGSTNVVWPHAGDAPALRELLSDADPAIRGLAAEALATLHDPDDVPRIAKLLSDTNESIPALGWNRIVTAALIPSQLDKAADAVDITRSWQPRRVCAYARAALKLMTGQDFGRVDFDRWWEREHGGRERVWYWQERLHRDLAAAAAVEWTEPRPASVSYEAWEKQQQQKTEARFERVRRAVGKELAELPAEVDVKVRLFAVNRYSTALGSELDEPLMARFDCHRLSSERLLELLERKGLWDDVVWDNNAYNNLVVQIAGQAEQFFKRKDVKRLRAVQAREHELFWNGKASLFVGISRLLPAARLGNLDDPDTRDGVLRKGIRTLTDVFARGAVARELVDVGLPANWQFLAGQFFAENVHAVIPDMRDAVLQEFAAKPRTIVKREELARLLLDRRFDALWTEPRGAMGDDQHRMDAFRAVNTYAGKEVLTSQHDARLVDLTERAKALVEVRKIVRETLVTKPRRRAGG